jgi:large repetitive protein
MRGPAPGLRRSLVAFLAAGVIAAAGAVGFTAQAGHAATATCAVTPTGPTGNVTLGFGSGPPVIVNGGVCATTGGSITISGNVDIEGGLTLSAGGSVTFDSGTNVTLTSGNASITGTQIDFQSGSALTDSTGQVTLNDDTFDLQGTLDAPNPPSLTGSSGDDSFTVDYANGASLPHGLSVDGAGGTNTLAVSDAGESTGSHTYSLDPTQIVRDSAPPITYTNVQHVRATGGDGAPGDTFNVTPSANADFTIAGGLPSTPPGDALTVDTTGTTSPTLTTGATGAGVFSFGNVQPVSYSGIETVVPQPPGITSANSATFSEGSSGSFMVTATGPPAPALTESGVLPEGVGFTDNGNGSATLSGTPASGTAGTYPLVIAANDGVLPNATQNFTLVVNPPALESISVAPGAETLGPGMTQQYTATGHYSDGSTKDLTSAVTWSSSDPQVASVSPTGLVKVPSKPDFATTTVQASLLGEQGTASLTASRLFLITVQPTISQLKAGAAERLRASGHFANGATTDITDQVRWSALPQGDASVTPQGLVQGRAPGGALVFATFFPAVGLAAVIVTR